MSNQNLQSFAKFWPFKKKEKGRFQPNYPYFCDEILKHCLKSEYIELVLEMHTSKLTISDKKFTPYDLNLKKLIDRVIAD